MALIASTLLAREALDEGRYWESLLTTANDLTLLDDSLRARLQREYRQLLLRLARAYTGGRSATLREERMEALAASLRFTLGARLRAIPQPLDALAWLQGHSLEDCFAEGRTIVDRDVRSAEIFYRCERAKFPALSNACLRSTFFEGIPAFFRMYNPEYGAHERHITADYPVVQDPSGFLGIDFIRKYLNSLHQENHFLRSMHPELVRRSLALYALRSDLEPSDLCDNLYQIVLACALCAFLPSKDPTGLEIAANHLLNRIQCASDSLRQYVLFTCRQDPAALLRIQQLVEGSC